MIAAENSVVVVGAGATGRGHVAQLAVESGYTLILLDKNKDLCSALRSAGAYSVRLVSAHTRTVIMKDFKIFHTSEKEAFYPFFRDSPLIFTAVCPGNLKEVAQFLRDLFIRWLGERGSDQFKNVLCCENMNHSTSTFRDFLTAGLPDSLRQSLEMYIGFPDTMVARVVARPSDPLSLLGEEYSEWTSDRSAIRGPHFPSIKTLEFVEDQAAYLRRKLYIHNTGHATFGYLGFLAGYTYIHEAAQDPGIMAICEKAIEESGWAIEREYGFSAEAIRKYRLALTEKCVSAELPDEILRVVREPARKLGAEERFLGPIGLMLKHGRQPEYLLWGVCAALLSRIPGDEQSGRIASLMAEKGAACIAEIAGGPVAPQVLSRLESLLPVVRKRFGGAS
jgi:mannitol-1-phosphate 5-dehydrogenase